MDKESEIHAAYVHSNIYLWHNWDIKGKIIHKNLWLAGMGMLETLIIMGIDAEVYNDYDEYDDYDG